METNPQDNMQNQQDNMQNNTQNPVYFEELKLSQRMALRREYNGFGMGVFGLILYFSALLLMVGGMIIFMMYFLTQNKQPWMFSGLFIANVGVFIVLTMMQRMLSKQRNLFKALGSQKRIILFFVSLVLLVINAGLVLGVLLKTANAVWFYRGSLFVSFVWAITFLIPYAKSPKKTESDKKLTLAQQAQIEQSKFYNWLKTEKNILGKNHKYLDITDEFDSNNDFDYSKDNSDNISVDNVGIDENGTTGCFDNIDKSN